MTRRSPFSIRKLVLLTLNLASTVLTLLTGLRENPVIVFVTGRYDHIRERLIGGTINYDNIRDDTVSREMLPDFKEVGKSYRLISSPRRSPENLAEDRSTCMYVNSLNASFYSLNYDDFWGKGARRAQIFMHSISAPHCNVINLKPEWYNDTCIASVGNGNATACHYYILDNFDAIKRDYTLQVGQQGGFGVIGVPLLKCLGRPEMKFYYYTDLIIEQQYWSGGSYHVEIQSSKCFALPLVRDHEWRWSLFQVDRLDYAANVVTAIDSSGWFVLLVTTLYGIVTIALILHGILASILRVRTVRYLPKAERFIKEYRILKYIFPFMMAARTVTDNANHVITFKGSLFMASDVWMNHWLYIMLSIFDSVASIRAMYMVLEMGTWMLTMKLNFENFLFMCSALTRITWLLCCVHTVVRYGLKLGLRSIKSMKVVRLATIERLEWFVDAWALFMSYKIYSMLVCIVFVFSLHVRGTTSFMKEAGTRGVFGGEPDITQFWGNEIMCDAVMILLIVFASGLGFTILMLQTKYRHVTQNGVIRLLQDRYIVVGWDVFVTLEALGMDPFNPDLVGDDGICRTNCSLGAILQQLYTSGLSGYVNLAADYLFLDNGFAQEPLKMRYPVKRAMAMDLCSSNRNTYTSGKATNDESVGVSTMRKDAAEEAKVMSAAICRTGPNAKSLFERRLKIVSEGYVGKIIFIDEDHPGHLVKSATSSLMEFEVQDALSTMSILDIKPLLGNEKKLHIH